jgi:hypothetical protein
MAKDLDRGTSDIIFYFQYSGTNPSVPLLSHATCPWSGVRQEMVSLARDWGKGYTSTYGRIDEDLLRYSREVIAEKKIDYFIFGHRHLPLNYIMKEGASR